MNEASPHPWNYDPGFLHPVALGNTRDVALAAIKMLTKSHAFAFRRGLAAGLLFVAGTAAVYADDTIASPIDFFDQNCLDTVPDFDGMIAKAVAKRWPELPVEIDAVLSPFVDANALKGWIASRDTDPLRVVVASSGTEKTDVVEGCTVGLSRVDTEGFEKSLVEKLGLAPQAEERDVERRYLKWLLPNGGRQKLVTVSLPLTGSATNQIVASVIVERAGPSASVSVP